MSKQRAKGTGFEVELLEVLALRWPYVERAALKGINDKGDFINVGPLLIEAKKTDAPHFQQWARTAEKKVGNTGWRVIWAGDRRKGAGQGPYVIVPLADWIELESDAWRHQVDKFSEITAK